MFNDSNSPRSDYNSLLSWLNLPETQEVLQLLKAESDELDTLIVNLTPSRDLGTFIGNFFHTEQSKGEIRGLRRLAALLNDRKLELERKIDPPKTEQVNPEY
jgi:hypothetical protein